jgi:hypothetical protein
MNRPLLLAALLFLLVSLPLFAQRGGGHGSFGGHGGGMTSHGGFSGHSGGHAFSGAHYGSGFAARPSARGSIRGPLSSRSFNHSGVGLRIRSRDFRNNHFGYGRGLGYGYPWLYGGAFDPYWWWDSGSSYDQDQENQIGLANEMNQQSLDEQRMRQQDDQDFYARSAPAPRHQQEHPDPDPTTVLIFRDQHKKEIQNYAIVGQTLWSFAAQHTEKIPLSDLDIPATQKANEDRGVDFRLPVSQEGQ